MWPVKSQMVEIVKIGRQCTTRRPDYCSLAEAGFPRLRGDIKMLAQVTAILSYASVGHFYNTTFCHQNEL